jgi:cellulose synthase/poly-beta-1,6-N-acetylglucosamine synthase-like glycosyltransferase
VKFKWSKKRRGKVNALNEETANSSGEFLLFIDCDIKIVKERFLGKVAAALREKELVDIKKQIIRDSLMAKLVSYEYLSGSLTSYIFDNLNGSCPQLNGACFAIRRETFERLGGFNKVLYEDLDLAFRAFQSDVSYSFADDIVVMNAVDPELEK